MSLLPSFPLLPPVCHITSQLLSHEKTGLGACGWAWLVLGFGKGWASKATAWALQTPCYMFLLCLPQSVLKKRDQVQAEYEAKLEAVALRKEDRPKVRGQGLGCFRLKAVISLLVSVILILNLCN